MEYTGKVHLQPRVNCVNHHWQETISENYKYYILRKSVNIFGLILGYRQMDRHAFHIRYSSPLETITNNTYSRIKWSLTTLPISGMFTLRNCKNATLTITKFVCMSTHNDTRCAGWIFIKFDTELHKILFSNTFHFWLKLGTSHEDLHAPL